MNKITHIKFKLGIPFLLAILLLGYPINKLEAQKVKREFVIASYLYQLSKNIHWPNAGNIKKYRFHIIDPDKRVYESLKNFSQKVQLHGKPITVTHSSSGSIPEGTHVVYCSKKNSSLLENFTDIMGNREILLVTQAEENKRIIMINLFETAENQLRFEINKANILNQSLGIEPDIILLGGTEIDVAKLFRESQITLKEQEQLIRKQKETVSAEKARIEELSTQALNQKRIIAQQEQDVLEQRNRLKKMLEKTETQKQFIIEQKSRVEQEKTRYSDLARESEEQQLFIRQQENAIREQENRLKSAVEKTKAQEQAIAKQNSRVEMEKKNYSQLFLVSEEQRNIINQHVQEILEQEQAITEQKSRVEKEKKRYTDLAAQNEEQQKLIALQQKTVLSEKARIENLSAQTKNQKKLIEKQDKAITTEKLKLDKVAAKTRKQSKIITRQGKQIEKEQKRYSDLARDSEAQQKLLDEQKLLADQERQKYEQLTKNVQEREIALKEQSKKIEARTAILKEQDEKIETQQETINKQETSLSLQSETINSQRYFLYAMGAVVFLLCGLAYAIYRGYRNKKLANAQLFEQKQLIQKSATLAAKSERKFRDLYDNSPELLLSIDLSTQNILECNNTLLKKLDYSKEELIGTNILNLYHPDSHELARKAFSQYLDEGHVHNAELQVIKKNGEAFPILLDVTENIEEETGKSYTRSAWRDISERKKVEKILSHTNEALEFANNSLKKEIEERKKAEKILAESEEKYHNYYEKTPDLQVSVDSETSLIIECNETVANATGYAKSEIIGKKIFDMYHPDSLEAAQKCFKQFVEYGEIKNEELQLKRKDGSRLDVLLSVTSYVSPDGKHRYSRSIWHDITERKKVELLLKKAKEETDQLNERLKEIDQLKSMFIASMSHELRTPLNAIIGFIGIILQGMVGKLDDKQKDFLGRAYRASKHLLSLISDVIDISKIESGSVQAYPEAFSLKDVILEAANYLQKTKEKEIELKIIVPSDIEIFNDRKRLFQCILNLLSNAMKYTERGEITVSTKNMEDQIEITVKDTGIGISEAGLKNLFLPFERLNSPLRIKEPGTGLGLYLTKKMAEEILDGSLEVESQPGVGSKFKLIFSRQLSNKEFDEVIPNLEGVQ
jgi:PAS domain S-box-containing protein